MSWTYFLCPNEDGAFKQTVHGEWAHLLCAIWIPETRVANEVTVFIEPINGVERISKQRWRLMCGLLLLFIFGSYGRIFRNARFVTSEKACIQYSCFMAYHITCARKPKFLMPTKALSGVELPPLQCFCEKHMLVRYNTTFRICFLSVFPT